MKRLISAALALTLLGSTAAVAAPQNFRPAPGHFDNRGNDRYDRGPAFHRGDRFDFRRSHYVVVNDWRGNHLRRPARGYHWVRYGNDYLMVALTTGLIADVILHSR